MDRFHIRPANHPPKERPELWLKPLTADYAIDRRGYLLWRRRMDLLSLVVLAALPLAQISWLHLSGQPFSHGAAALLVAITVAAGVIGVFVASRLAQGPGPGMFDMAMPADLTAAEQRLSRVEVQAMRRSLRRVASMQGFLLKGQLAAALHQLQQRTRDARAPMPTLEDYGVPSRHKQPESHPNVVQFRRPTDQSHLPA